MKRNNPETGKPFKQGFVRQDGLVFWGYQKDCNASGLRGEMWITPEKFATKRDYINKRSEAHWYRAGMLLARAKHRCLSKKSGNVTITKEDIFCKLVAGNCELTGLPFDLSKPSAGIKNNLYAPSLDRIDNSNPDYSPENTRVVLVAVNQALNEHGELAVLPVLKALVAAIDKKFSKNAYQCDHEENNHS